MGGMVAAVESGYARQLIDQAAFAWSDRSKRKSVSSSASTITQTMNRRTCTSSKSAKRSASARSTGLTRSERDATARRSLLHSRRCDRPPLDPTQNLMPSILAAVRAYCSIGEICGVLRDVFGEYPIVGPAVRSATLLPPEVFH